MTQALQPMVAIHTLFRLVRRSLINGNICMLEHKVLVNLPST